MSDNEMYAKEKNHRLPALNFSKLMLVLLYFTSMSESRFGVIIFGWSNQDEWVG